MSDDNKQFHRMNRLPPYLFSQVVEQMMSQRRKGEDIIDLGMGNPDLPTPQPIVDKMKEALDNPRNHRYSMSRGIPGLRQAICNYYQSEYEVELDPETEVIATIGAKEGLSHFVLVTVGPGDVVFVPNPTYPIHSFSVVIAGGDLRHIPLTEDVDFFEALQQATKLTWPLPKMIILSFPHNPTTKIVDREFFVKLVDWALENKIWLVHDLAYADICFDGYKAPSLLEVPRAKEIGVEFYSMSKGYSMPGWRVGFCAGNPKLVAALSRIKSYLDYGIFQPIQIASAVALNEYNDLTNIACNEYQFRRDVLIDGLENVGWHIEKPKATMFVWAKIPEQFSDMDSLAFSLKMLNEANVAVSPGAGFGGVGEGYVRFALIENEHRIKQAIRGIRRMMS